MARAKKPPSHQYETRDTEELLPPGSTFAFELVPSDTVEVTVVASLPGKTRGIQIGIPPILKEQLQRATRGLNVLTALVALADYAAERLEKGKPCELHAVPIDSEETDSICNFIKRPADELTLVVDKPLVPRGFHADRATARRRVPMPTDVRQRVEAMMATTEDGRVYRFSTAIIALAQWALQDLAKRKKRLIVTKASATA